MANSVRLEYLRMPALALELDGSAMPGSGSGQLIADQDPVGVSSRANTGVEAQFGILRVAPIQLPEPSLGTLHAAAIAVLAGLARFAAPRARTLRC